jgi:hypothetical protein
MPTPVPDVPLNLGKVLIWQKTTDVVVTTAKSTTADAVSMTAQENMKAYNIRTYFFGNFGNFGSATTGESKWTAVSKDLKNIVKFDTSKKTNLTYNTKNYADVTGGDEKALFKAMNDEWNAALAKPTPTEAIKAVIAIVGKHDAEFSFRTTLEQFDKDTLPPISGIHAMKLCDLFNATYEKDGLRIKHIGWDELVGVASYEIVGEVVNVLEGPDGKGAKGKYIEALFVYATLAKFINMCIDRLNAACESGKIRELTFGNMSADKSLKRENKTFVGGAMRGGFEPVQVDLVKNAIMGYNADFKNYMFGGIPANFEMNYGAVGGASGDLVAKLDSINTNKYTTSHAKKVGNPNANRSSDYFAKAFAEIQTGAKQKGLELENTFVGEINTAINALRAQEEILLKQLDSGVMGVYTGLNKEIKTAGPDEEAAYKKLFSTVDSIARKESRIYAALFSLLGRVGYVTPTIAVATPLTTGLRLRP